MSAPIKSSGGSFWIQRTVGKASTYVPCIDLDAIVEPQGDQTLINCRNKDGVVVAVGASYAPPGAVTTGFKILTFPESDIVDELGRCEFAYYAQMRNCGKAGNFSNWVRTEIGQRARVTSRQIDNVAMRETDEATMRTFAVSSFNPVYRPRMVEVARQAVAETGDLNAIAFCNALQCAGDCGPFIDIGTIGYTGGLAASGSPTTLSDVWGTLNSGSAWTTPGGGASHPFGAGVDIKGMKCIQLDTNTSRIFAVRDQVGGEAFKIAYSDDGGVTWTLVTLGSTNNEGGLFASCIYAPDRDHIWVCTSAGNVYFSSDAGTTYTVQSGAVTAASSKALNAIHFSDYEHGWAGGVTSALIQTSDGGSSWAAVAPPVAMSIRSLYAFSKERVIIGGTTDELYETWDGFVSDTEAKTYSGKSTTGVVAGLAFNNDHVGFMIHNTAAGVGTIFRSVDGGHIWDALTTPSNLGLNDIVALDDNTAFAVGNAKSGTAVILKVAA